MNINLSELYRTGTVDEAIAVINARTAGEPVPKRAVGLLTDDLAGVFETCAKLDGTTEVWGVFDRTGVRMAFIPIRQGRNRTRRPEG